MTWLLEELVSRRFLVDSETAHPEEPNAWLKFRQDRVPTPRAFRVYGTLSDYYNFEFEHRKHVAVEIEVPGSEERVNGYVRRASRDSMRLLKAVQGQISVPLILSLRHPRRSKDPSQVIIDRFVQGDWVILDDAVAPTFGERELVSRSQSRAGSALMLLPNEQAVKEASKTEERYGQEPVGEGSCGWK